MSLFFGHLFLVAMQKMSSTYYSDIQTYSNISLEHELLKQRRTEKTASVQQSNSLQSLKNSFYPTWLDLKYFQNSSQIRKKQSNKQKIKMKALSPNWELNITFSFGVLLGGGKSLFTFHPSDHHPHPLSFQRKTFTFVTWS